MVAERYRFSERRQAKRRQRQLRRLRGWWQVLLCSSLVWGIWRLTNAPFWYLYDLGQVTIEGENLLPEAGLKAHLNLSLPQYLFRLEPQRIARQLQSQAPLAAVQVQRRLFPTQLVIRVKERVPVARAMYEGKNGYIDTEGVWIPATSYPTKLHPPLTVVGFDDQVRAHWAELYSLVARSPVAISQINWLDRNNLILATELGVVHCGNFERETFAKQLAKLDRMRSLPQVIKGNNIKYLDFRDLAAPTAKFSVSLP
ncbi:MAG: FtsQ-type POTRA domain-containing protein [Pseudanabaenaceae cyanobacterium SKYGB_i_bin29]|nr:FtsQ-type POTRA domain-containing protein [Pseudanabaenaceae cyanobacterium SKYG29]MDW8422211.1 FtsQ-type POTRA domain-containing protein [Pseudanabaenaceae cyanobacterium SKYGB_i_bin29]